MLTPLLQLEAFGQSIWLDYLQRDLIISGKLQDLIEGSGLKGVTSNPSIFEKAISSSHSYDAAIKTLALQGKDAEEIYTSLTVQDIQDAADVLRPVWECLRHLDGFVSLEVDPHIAYDVDKQIEEGRRLWELVNRPNVFIKIPATKPGLQAIRQLISEGINVNVTLLFGLARYREVVDAYLSGLEQRVQQRLPIEDVQSVASFFLSRIDVLLDPQLEALATEGGQRATLAQKLLGQIAIASARQAYHIFDEIFTSERARQLVAKGGSVQRLLWASTSTKNPAYSDTKYVDALIAPNTINTLPLETIEAYADHGNPEVRIFDEPELTHMALEELGQLGLDLEQATKQLEEEGVRKFCDAYDKLLETLRHKRDQALQQPLDDQHLYLPSALQQAVSERLQSLEQQDFTRRLWERDVTLWKSAPDQHQSIKEGLGWLDVATHAQDNVPELLLFANQVKRAGIKHIVHMGMGGSSLAPLVFQQCLPRAQDALPLTVLDTTDPQTIYDLTEQLPLTETLFIVASKSGTTAEPQAFEDYFYEKLRQRKGDKAGENFVAITDAGSLLEVQARNRKYRRTFLNFSDIGGRYSALSYFGLVPAALQGSDIGELLARTQKMAQACGLAVPLEQNPGVMLGVVMAEAALQGRDKITILTSEELGVFGLWLEQLIAESTGKEGKGLLPVAREPMGLPETYGNDRLFVAVTINGEDAGEVQQTADALRQAGQPVISTELGERLDFGQEMLRWEIAVATAGAILRINPFDQPNVQESKTNTNQLLSHVEEQGSLPEPKPALTEGALTVYGQISAASLQEALEHFLQQVHPDAYFDLMAYLPETPEIDRLLQDLRRELKEALRVAVTAGYGPRFLHSTGQYHKGGPNTGVFLQLTAQPSVRVPLPGRPYDFGTFIKAQALGDMQALQQHGRRILRVDLGQDVLAGLQALRAAVQQSLQMRRQD